MSKFWWSWNRNAVIAMVVGLLALVGFNVWIDPYGVFKTKNGLVDFSLNERYRKVEFIRHNIGRFDSFVIGSSTMGLMPTEHLHEYAGEGKWYNLAYLAGTPSEALSTLKYLKRIGQPINEVMFGVDLFAYRHAEKPREFWKKEHPEVAGVSWPKWWVEHLMACSVMDGMERVTQTMHKTPKLRYDIEGTGRYYLAQYDEARRTDPAAFAMEHHKEKQSDRNGKTKIVFIQERFDELKSLADWLRENRIKSHFWINPMHHSSYEVISDESMGEFRSRVFQAVGKAPDYSQRSEITGNDLYFYDDKHFVPEVGERIEREVLKGVAS